MSPSLPSVQRYAESLEARIRELELEIKKLSLARTPTQNGFAEIAIARHLETDTGAAALASIDGNGAQSISSGRATLLEIISGALKPIDNAARTNPFSVAYVNATKTAPETDEENPFVLARSRGGPWIRLPGGSGTPSIIVEFELDADMPFTAPGSAAATVLASSDPDTLAVSSTISVTSSGAIRAKDGCRGIAVQAGEQFWVVEIQQPSLFILGTLGASPGASESDPSYGAKWNKTTAKIAGGYSLTPFPFDWLPSSVLSADHPNPFKLNGLVGDDALWQYDATNDQYKLVEIFPKRGKIVGFRFQAAYPSTGFSNALANGTWSSGGDTIANGTTVHDPYMLGARVLSTHDGVAVFNELLDRYEAVAIRHHATRITGEVGTDFLSTDDTCTLISCSGLDGTLASNTVTGIKNIHKWEGKTGGKGKAEWNQSAGQWELYQIDCSEEQPTASPGPDPEGGGGGGGV